MTNEKLLAVRLLFVTGTQVAGVDAIVTTELDDDNAFHVSIETFDARRGYELDGFSAADRDGLEEALRAQGVKSSAAAAIATESKARAGELVERRLDLNDAPAWRALEERCRPDDFERAVFRHEGHIVVLRLRFEDGRATLTIDDGVDVVCSRELTTLADLDEYLPDMRDEGYTKARDTIMRAFAAPGGMRRLDGALSEMKLSNPRDRER